MARDKKLHFAGGALIAAILIFWIGPWWSLLAVAAVGAGKEVYDATGRGTPEFADFVWTVAGWVPVAGAWIAWQAM